MIIFLNGIYQEPEVSYILNGSILEFAEPLAQVALVRSLSTQVLILTLLQKTHTTLWILAIRSRSSQKVTKELLLRLLPPLPWIHMRYTGLRPNVAAFTAVVVNGKVIDVIITDAGSNYEVPPVLAV